MKVRLVWLIAPVLLILATLIAVLDAPKERSFGNMLSGCDFLLKQWTSRASWSDISDVEIGRLEIEFESQGFDLVELQIVNPVTHEILAEKSSGRKKLSAWFPSEKKTGNLFWEGYDYEGREGEFEVVRFRYPLEMNNIEIRGLLKID